MLKVVLASVPLVFAGVLAFLTVRNPRGSVFTFTGDTFLEDVLGDAMAQKVHLTFATICTAFAVLLALQALRV